MFVKSAGKTELCHPKEKEPELEETAHHKGGSREQQYLGEGEGREE